MRSTIVTKAEFARELQCARSRVTQLVKAGMPARDDGKLDRYACLTFISSNTSGIGGGWTGLTRKTDLASRAAALLGRNAGKLPTKTAADTAAVPSDAYLDRAFLDGKIRATAEITDVREIARFALFCRRIGISAEHTYMVACWLGLRPWLAVSSLDCDDLPETEVWPDWDAVLGSQVDCGKLDLEFDRATHVDMSPEDDAAVIKHEAELDRLLASTKGVSDEEEGTRISAVGRHTGHARGCGRVDGETG
ncbi:MAG: hypothetical protein P4L40_09820 [Terracidiphilus sp.]|nr:hypothetical protein [Terracidiphilus sp.]